MMAGALLTLCTQSGRHTERCAQPAFFFNTGHGMALSVPKLDLPTLSKVLYPPWKRLLRRTEPNFLADFELG